MKIVSTQQRPWNPDKPATKGATAFHEAVFNSTWIRDITYELANITSQNINDGDIVVDFGAGTGTSAIFLLEYIKKKYRLWLVDNSPSWLGKAYELLNNPPKVECFLLEKKDDRYATLAQTVGEEIVDHVISANTVHLIQDLEEAFNGVSAALKKNGTFTFETGNFIRENRPDGALMIDDTIKSVHDIAINTVRTNPEFADYRKDLDKRAEAEELQRRLVFPDPRPVEVYLKTLKAAGLNHQQTIYIPVKVRYDDWLNFLRVKRLQAGILQEIGGKEPSPKEEKDRDTLITEAALQLFKDLELNNSLADKECFTIDIVYITSFKE